MAARVSNRYIDSSPRDTGNSNTRWSTPSSAARVVGDPRALGVLNAHELRLGLEPPEADAGDDAAAGQLVGGGEHLRQQQRVTVGNDEDRGADLNARGDAGDVGHGRHGFEER